MVWLSNIKLLEELIAKDQEKLKIKRNLTKIYLPNSLQEKLQENRKEIKYRKKEEKP